MISSLTQTGAKGPVRLYTPNSMLLYGSIHVCLLGVYRLTDPIGAV